MASFIAQLNEKQMDPWVRLLLILHLNEQQLARSRNENFLLFFVVRMTNIWNDIISRFLCIVRKIYIASVHMSPKME